MKVISDRVSILKEDGLFSLVILPTTDKKKLGLMLLWLLAWTVCGIIVFLNYFKLSNKEAKLFVLVYLSFWFYYEYKITKAFLWKSSGKEKLWIKNNILFYQREVSGRGKINQYNLDLVSDLGIIEVDKKRFADSFNQSFWVKGGERLEFKSQSKMIGFGMQISDEEAKQILKELRQYIKG